jgi:hypothetical protein
MKPSDLKAGKTYVGKDGKRRHLWGLVSAGLADLPYRMATILATYDVPEGGESWCTAHAFARWAEREATPEEQAK